MKEIQLAFQICKHICAESPANSGSGFVCTTCALPVAHPLHSAQSVEQAFDCKVSLSAERMRMVSVILETCWGRSGDDSLMH
jgi:coenzyme F420-reducing hydrogenase alpha subunit